MLTRRTSVRFLVALLISMSVAVVFATSPHYKKGGQPVCTATTSNQTDTTVTVNVDCSVGAVTGLGNDDVQIKVTVNAAEGQLCHNGGNGLVVPGHNPATAIGTSTLNIPKEQIKNGNLALPAITFDFGLTASTDTQTECGNNGNGWTITLNGDLTFSGHYDFYTPPTTLINALSFVF
jgi:hypothetical protein